MGGYSDTINGLTGSGTVDNSVSGTPTFTVGGNNVSSAFSGVIKNTAGTLALVKTGTGALTLSGTDAYTGATTVSFGTLLVNGSIASSSGVSVASGATLGGSGSVPTISGAGLVSVGNSPGILTAPSVTTSGGVDFAMEFTHTGSPTYGSPTASVNDVLHLTGATPFSRTSGLAMR